MNPTDLQAWRQMLHDLFRQADDLPARLEALATIPPGDDDAALGVLHRVLIQQLGADQMAADSELYAEQKFAALVARHGERLNHAFRQVLTAVSRAVDRLAIAGAQDQGEPILHTTGLSAFFYATHTTGGQAAHLVGVPLAMMPPGHTGRTVLTTDECFHGPRGPELVLGPATAVRNALVPRPWYSIRQVQALTRSWREPQLREAEERREQQLRQERAAEARYAATPEGRLAALESRMAPTANH